MAGGAGASSARGAVSSALRSSTAADPQRASTAARVEARVRASASPPRARPPRRRRGAPPRRRERRARRADPSRGARGAARGSQRRRRGGPPMLGRRRTRARGGARRGGGGGGGEGGALAAAPSPARARVTEASLARRASAAERARLDWRSSRSFLGTADDLLSTDLN